MTTPIQLEQHNNLLLTINDAILLVETIDGASSDLLEMAILHSALSGGERPYELSEDEGEIVAKWGHKYFASHGQGTKRPR